MARASRVLRRPPTAEELQRVVKLGDNAQQAGDKWEASIQFAMQAVRCSPKFLFRQESAVTARGQIIGGSVSGSRASCA